MRVFPVLVGGAKMPSPEDLPAELQALCRRNALEITEQDWDEDLAKLIKGLEIALGVRPSPPPVDRGSAFKKWGLAAVVAVAALVLLVVYMGKPAPSRPVTPDPKPDPPSPIVVNPAPRNFPSPAPDLTPEPPRRPALTPAHFIGNWDAVVSGQQGNQLVSFYGDNSVGVMVRGAAVAVGRWRYNPAAESLEIANTTNLLNNVKFACTWKSVGSDQLSGNCMDRLRNSWTVSLTHQGGNVPEASYPIPRVNLSALTIAERAAFAQLLASRRCTCNCRMTVLVCLEKDRSCKYSPNLAQNALANFLRMTRG
jgi:hypothetical protein